LGLAAAWAGDMECTEEGTLAWFEAQVQEVSVNQQSSSSQCNNHPKCVCGFA
jgi:hypothetical protein